MGSNIKISSGSLEMKTKAKSIIFFTLMFLFILTGVTFAQERYEIIIASTDIIYNEPKYIRKLPLYTTRALQQNFYSIFVGYNYYLTLSLKLSGPDFYYDKPIVVICKLPDESIIQIILNEEHEYMTDEYFYYFDVEILSKNFGWTELSLAEWDDENNVIVNREDITFLGKSVYLE